VEIILGKIRVLSVFGTRPEAIKMAPLVKALESDSRFESLIAITAQHREMLDQVLQTFQLKSDYDMDIMKQDQTLTDITDRVLTNLHPILKEVRPDIVLVHGDTTTAFAAAIAAFYQQIPIGHVEAGLRTWNKHSPYPEEMNRKLIDDLSDLYFAPTERSRENLIKENHPEKAILITGNTAIDAMRYTVSHSFEHEFLPKNLDERKMILVTMHRRENMGDAMFSVFKGISRIALERPEVEVVFPMHKNPEVRKIALFVLGNLANVHLIEPLNVVDFHNFVARSYLVLTDSGGIQEEAPLFGVPVLVLRDTTERPEGVIAGTLKIIGTDEIAVYKETLKLFDPEAYKKMSEAKNPYGDGKASERILDGISDYFCIN